MPDREVPDPVISSDSAPPPKNHFLRIPRALRRRAVTLPILATLLLGVDAWMIVAIQGWQDQADTLRSKSTDLGESIAVAQAEVESAVAKAELLAIQTTAAEVRVGELADEAAAERARMDAFTNVSLAFEECATDRLKFIKGLLDNSQESIANLEAAGVAECAAAQDTFDALIAAGG